jgi:hypothetical protein
VVLETDGSFSVIAASEEESVGTLRYVDGAGEASAGQGR